MRGITEHPNERRWCGASPSIRTSGAVACHSGESRDRASHCCIPDQRDSSFRWNDVIPV